MRPTAIPPPTLLNRLVVPSIRLQWRCLSCQRALAPLSRRRPRTSRRPDQNHRRPSSTESPATAQTQARAQQARGARSPTMEEWRGYHKQKNRTLMNYTISIILGMATLAYGSVPLYKMVCQTTGWGGQPVRAHGSYDSASDASDQASRLVPVANAKRIRVQFHACVSDVLPWKFTPQQREVRVLPGETALAFYTATNRSDSDIIGVATYSVTPVQVAPYFAKIQCFCFEEQRLAAGETVDMPVFFYLDPDLLKDVNMKGIDSVTLNYTFFKARYDNNGQFSSPLSGK